MASIAKRLVIDSGSDSLYFHFDKNLLRGSLRLWKTDTLQSSVFPDWSSGHPLNHCLVTQRARYFIFEYMKKRPYHFGMTSEYFKLYMIELSNPQKRRCASMKNESLEFPIQNSRNPHKRWFYGPYIYIGQMFW